MINLLSKVDQRRLNLVGFLHNYDGFVKYSTLTESLGVSDRIIRDDLHNLKQLNHIFDIQLLPELVKLRFHKNTGYESITRYFMDNNLSFKIIEALFFHENIDIDELAEELYISTSTLYRRFQSIENSIKKQYNILIQTNPCRFIGEEKDIRTFFFTFFTEKYGIFEWPFDSILSLDDAVKLVSDVLKILDLHYDYPLLRHIRYVATIGLHRYKQGRLLNFDQTDLKKDIVDLTLKELDIQYYNEAFSIEVNEAFLNEMFAPFLQTNVFFNQDELYDGIESNEVGTVSYFKLLKICNKLSKKYNIPLSNRDELITSVHSTFFLGDSEPYMHHLINNKKVRFMNRFQMDFPKFYQDLNTLMSEFLNDMGKTRDQPMLDHMMYTFIIYWENLTKLLKATDDKVSVYIISSTDEYHAKMLKDLIEFEFSNHVNITIGKNIEDIGNIFPSGLYDMVVTNFPYTKESEVPVICIDDFPSKYDMLVILKEIMNIIDKNTRYN